MTASLAAILSMWMSGPGLGPEKFILPPPKPGYLTPRKIARNGVYDDPGGGVFPSDSIYDQYGYQRRPYYPYDTNVMPPGFAPQQFAPQPPPRVQFPELHQISSKDHNTPPTPLSRSQGSLRSQGSSPLMAFTSAASSRAKTRPIPIRSTRSWCRQGTGAATSALASTTWFTSLSAA
jgi:hypothetical protein